MEKISIETANGRAIKIKTFGITYMYIYIHARTHVRAGLINCWECDLKCNRQEPHAKSPWATLEIFLGQLHDYSA